MLNNSIFKKILSPSNFKRFLFFSLFDILIITLSLYLSFFLRFEFTITSEYKDIFFKALPFFIIIKLITFLAFRMYRITWGYVGLRDLSNIVKAVLVSESLLMFLIIVLLREFPGFLSPKLANFVSVNIAIKGFPRSIFFIDGAISLLLLSGLRISKRVFLEIFSRKRLIKKGLKTLIIGGGNTGEMIIRDIARQGFANFYPVALLDDAISKVGAYIHGVKIFGGIDDLKYVVSKLEIEAIIIAIPSLDHKAIRKIYTLSRESGVKTIKIVPRIYDYHKIDINLKSLEEISIEDLIGRQVVKINYEEIEVFLKDKVVLITGAGGSIGSEITMQIGSFNPKMIILLDIDETDLHNMEIKLKKAFPHFFENSAMGIRDGKICPLGYLDKGDKVYFTVADIRDKDKIERVFKKFKPQIVFHAAAYKHVPVMEYNPDEAVMVNIFGTYNMAETTIKYGVEKFILISTDKAVKPTSVMGATKRIAEYICKAVNEDKCQKNNPLDPGATTPLPPLLRGNEKTEFISVRFGNVLGSRGSVLPLFMEQLRHGGPLTVTHMDMKRYFMTIPEAVSLVLQASVIGNGGEVLVLDMGKPVEIVKLAEELIRINGLEPYKDIDIKFIGSRPGENLFEEILTAEEGTVASKHKRIFIARNSDTYSVEDIKSMIREFQEVISDVNMDATKIKILLKKYVRYFVNKGSN